MSITTHCGVALLATKLLTAPTVTKAEQRADCSALGGCGPTVEILRRPVGELPQGTADASGYEKDVPGPAAEPDRKRPRTRGYEEPPCGFDRYDC